MGTFLYKKKHTVFLLVLIVGRAHRNLLSFPLAVGGIQVLCRPGSGDVVLFGMVGNN